MEPGCDVDSILAAIPHLRRGPGGSAAVLKDGEVLSQRSWGYASLNGRNPMTPKTILPICSISKQMVCLALVSLCRNPTPAMLMKSQTPEQLLDAEMKTLLPHLVGLPEGELRIDHLHNMQSGIRDYWGLSTLWGARPDDPFSISIDAPKALARVKSFHFAPGTEFSYSNVNFYVLGKILENVSGQSLSQLLSERVFVPAGMSSASLYINTEGLPRPIVGYEGNEQVGFFAALNRIEWAGDAGIAASLDDMIAYERYLDRSWSDPSSLYHHTAQQPTYNDGTPAAYGYGLMRNEVAGRTVIRHGGALRGFRLHRLHVPSERISVVVMLNHDSDALGAADYILKKLLGHTDPAPSSALKAHADWNGSFLDEQRGRVLTIKTGEDKRGQLAIRYKGGDEYAKLTSESEAETPSMTAAIDGNTLDMHRKDDKYRIRARRLAKPSDLETHNAKSADYVGVYRSDEMDITLHCTGNSGTLYGSFDGYLGSGPVWLMRYIGEDVWILGNPRGLDSTPPGDWTVVFHRNEKKAVERVTIGCFLAWNIELRKQ